MNTDDAYRELAGRLGKPDSAAVLSILNKAMTADEARFVLALPASNEELAAGFGRDEQSIQNTIDGLAQRGLVVTSRKGLRFPRDLGTLHDNILASSPEFIPEGIGKLWMELYEGGWWQDIVNGLVAYGQPIMRYIPAQKAVPPDVELLPGESVKAIIEAHKDLITLRNCCCRVGARYCDHPTLTCIQFGRRAQYDLRRGSGKQISADEAIASALASEQSGLMPTVTNMADVDKLEFICFCCACCCLVINPLKRAGQLEKGMSPSRFQAQVDEEKCDGCQTCVDRCYFEAIEMQDTYEGPRAVVDPKTCVGCGLCAISCERGAITLKLIRPPEHIPETLTGPSTVVGT